MRDKGVDEELEMKIGKIGEKLKEGERESGRRKRVGWWDEECEGKRREVRRTLREWRRRGGEGEKYRKERAEYKLLCKRKRGEENERWIKEAQKARTEGEVWGIVNKERKRRKGINEGIEGKEWRVLYEVVRRGRR